MGVNLSHKFVASCYAGIQPGAVPCVSELSRDRGVAFAECLHPARVILGTLHLISFLCLIPRDTVRPGLLTPFYTWGN